MNISAQPITGRLLRAHPPGMGYGDPYTWTAVAAPDPEDPSTAIVFGALTAPEEPKAVFGRLRSLGYTRVQWERIKNGQHRHTRAFRL